MRIRNLVGLLLMLAGCNTLLGYPDDPVLVQVDSGGGSDTGGESDTGGGSDTGGESDTGGGTCAGSSSQTCGNCGTQSRTCDNGTWSAWGTCTGEGVCAPTATQTCGTGTQTCSGTCTWGNCLGQTCIGSSSQTCGNCGTQSRTCDNGTWGAWGSCTGEGACTANTTQACGSGGTQTCLGTCQWDVCMQCAGASSQTCGNCGTQSRTCTSGAWGAWGTCTGQGVCAPTATQTCGTGGTQTCSGTCTWGNCLGQTCTGSSSQTCGNCGTQSRTCTNGAWGAWSSCSGGGVCASGTTQSCGTDGTQTCVTLTCQWGSCVCTGASSQTCATGGTQTRTCTNGTWGAWGVCVVGGEFPQWHMPNPATSGLPNLASYTVNADGTVRDNVTALTWQQTLTTTTFTWANAKTYCTNLSDYGGGWRLPTAIELVSLVDFTRNNPAIDTTAFPNTPSTYFWTSSAVSGSSGFAWNVNFYFGNTNNNVVGNFYRVRCVR